MKRYRGRFGFCPAWITDPEGDCIVEPRYWVLWPLLWASEAMFGFYFWVKRNDPDFEPMWPILVEDKAISEGHEQSGPESQAASVQDDQRVIVNQDPGDSQ